MELLIAHGLAEPRTTEHASPKRPAPCARQTDPPTPTPKHAIAAELATDEDDIRRWAEMLDANSRRIRQLAVKRAWSSRVIGELELGFDGARITIPIRDGHGALCGVLRYDPFGRRDPKMLAVPGTQIGLIPHPTRDASDHIILVEGPPDMIAARSCGLPAIAVPGTTAWQQSWAELLAGRRVTIVMDCDEPGRQAAHEVATSLRAAAIPTDVVDLWPDRLDGYDLTDRILERQRTRISPPTARTTAALLRSVPSVQHNRTRARARNSQEAAR